MMFVLAGKLKVEKSMLCGFSFQFNKDSFIYEAFIMI